MLTFQARVRKTKGAASGPLERPSVQLSRVHNLEVMCPTVNAQPLRLCLDVKLVLRLKHLRQRCPNCRAHVRYVVRLHLWDHLLPSILERP